MERVVIGQVGLVVQISRAVTTRCTGPVSMDLFELPRMALPNNSEERGVGWWRRSAGIQEWRIAVRHRRSWLTEVHWCHVPALDDHDIPTGEVSTGRFRFHDFLLLAPVFGRSQVQAHSGGNGDLERTWSDDPAEPTRLSQDPAQARPEFPEDSRSRTREAGRKVV